MPNIDIKYFLMRLLPPVFSLLLLLNFSLVTAQSISVDNLCEGTMTSFTVNSDLEEVYSYQWQISVDGVEWNNIYLDQNPSNTSQYNLSSLGLMYNNNFIRCKININQKLVIQMMDENSINKVLKKILKK